MALRENQSKLTIATCLKLTNVQPFSTWTHTLLSTLLIHHITDQQLPHWFVNVVQPVGNSCSTSRTKWVSPPLCWPMTFWHMTLTFFSSLQVFLVSLFCCLAAS